MIEDFFKIFDFLNSTKAEFKNPLLKGVIQNYKILNISDINSLNDLEKQNFIQKLKESKVMVIKQIENYMILGFEKTLIIQEYSEKIDSLLTQIYEINYEISVCFLSNQDNSKGKSNNFEKEIKKLSDYFVQNLLFTSSQNTMKKTWGKIVPCISAYLIKKSYFKLNKNRIKQFILDVKNKTNSIEFDIDENEYVELRDLAWGTFMCTLIYHIKNEELYVIKKQHIIDIDAPRWIDREKANYTKIKHPFIPKYYGQVKNENKNYIVIEYINGKTLDNIKKMQLNINEKLTIIYELMSIILYIHTNKMVYRDLKPSNIIIDENNTLVLIDFDRLIEIDNYEEISLDVGSGEFTDPEICNSKTFTYKNDIYSLKKVIEYILNDGNSSNDLQTIDQQNEYLEYISKIDKEKPISDIYHEFFLKYQQNIQLNNSFIGFIKTSFNSDPFYFGNKYIQCAFDKQFHYYYAINASMNDPRVQFHLGLIYDEGKYISRDINKAIHYYSLAANQNYPQAQNNLGFIYIEGKYISRDINKAIHYYSLAANQNDPKAQFHLGLIYDEGEYISRDINKAIHYYSLAANQNDPKAQFNLGLIYCEGKYISRDINKAIHYYSLAANQNDPKAQFNLGLIYDEGKYISRDINKAIHYYSLAANQNIPQAQNNLGFIYIEGKYISRDINKAIHYYSLAANQNDPQAQNNLGLIYCEGKYISRDINKAIHYYSLAANQNIPQAQFHLGLIYCEGKYISRDINKAIHYYSLAANQNDPKAQFNLGLIYCEGKYISRDINKAIHYYSLAANQNYPQAQNNLGFIYIEGKYISRDINKAIHYYSLAANQNDPQAQFHLGLIYDEGKYISRDINKAIHYYSLAANQNIPQAQFHLGLIYCEGKYISRDINKAIHYYSLAANQNDPKAQFHLGLIYDEGKYISRDINKAIHYYSFAANKNDPQAQFILGILSFEGMFIPKNIKKGIFFIELASKNRLKNAHFCAGYFYHKGDYITRDIRKAIHYYNEGSSFNDQYAKNNLAIIYKNGYGDEIRARTANAIEYLEEAIRQKNDILSMYNLANIYIYDESYENKIDKAIELLFKSFDQFPHSCILLCLALIKKFGFQLEEIEKHVRELNSKKSKADLSSIFRFLDLFQSTDDFTFYYYSYEYYRDKYFLYNHLYEFVSLSEFLKQKRINMNQKNVLDINSVFYEGFGIEI